MFSKHSKRRGATGARERRTLTTAALALAATLATTAFAFAATLESDAVLSSNALLPTEVSRGSNAFQIKVWATGNTSGGGTVQVADKYAMAADGTVTANTTDTASVTFAAGNYSQICSASPAPSGCPTNPKIVDATLDVASTAADGTAGTVTVYTSGTQQVSADPSPDAGYVKVKVVSTGPAPDTTAPDAPSIDLVASSDSGASSTDDKTNDNTPTFAGLAEALSTVTLYRDTTSVGSTTADSTGAWSITPSAAFDDGTYSMTATAGDAANNVSQPSSALSVLIDTLAPGIAPTSVANTTWRNTPLAQTFTASDGGSGLAPNQGLSSDDQFILSASAESTKDGDGNVIPTSVSKTVADVAGNQSARSVSAWIDLTAPTSVVTGFTSGQQFTFGTGPTRGCDADDVLSGVAGDGTPTSDSSQLTSNGVGTVSVTCNGATDNAGNTQTLASAASTYRLVYGVQAAIGQPINADGSSVFSQKRAVPVKFALANDPVGGFDTTNWQLRREGQSCDPEAWVDEGLAATTSSSTGLRYDQAADQYIANATLAGTSVGQCYRFVVALDDGTRLPSPKFKVGK